MQHPTCLLTRDRDMKAPMLMLLGAVLGAAFEPMFARHVCDLLG